VSSSRLPCRPTSNVALACGDDPFFAAEHCVEHVVVVFGIVVERHEPPDFREPGEGQGVAEGAVTPAHALRVFGFGVLRVVEQDVGSGRDIEPRTPLGGIGEVRARKYGLVIGQVGQASLIAVQAVPDRRSRMAHERGAP
jgi:hypothetical protein